MMKEIALTYGRGKGATELGQKYGLSKQRILQLVSTLRKKGIVIPLMRLPYAGAIEEAVKQLKADEKSKVVTN